MVVAAILIAGLASGCSATVDKPVGSSNPGGQVELSTGHGPSETAGAESPAATLSPETAQLQQTIEAALTTIASSESKPAQETLRSHMVAAGIAASTLEVSASRTPTGLDVEAIEVAARLGKDCVMGEIRDGKVAMAVLPVLASGKCFLGDFR